VGDGTLQETLDRVAHLAKQAIPDADMTAITMLVEGRTTTAVFTNELAPEIDSAQYESGEGPCLDAFRHKTVFRIHDTEKDQRFSAFCESASANGVRSVLSLPLVAIHEGVGALNLYSRHPDAFSDEEVELGMAFAGQAAIVLANAHAYWDAYQLGQDLNEAMKSRAAIEQAKGILMGAQRCTSDEAFQMLIRASQRENRKLREIADEIVARTAEPRPRP
jgi:GAF domain-containing protein